MNDARYIVVCIGCGEVAFVLTNCNLLEGIRGLCGSRRTPTDKTRIDATLFNMCNEDSLFATVCYECERKRSESYGLQLHFAIPPNHVPHGRLTSPNMSKTLLLQTRALPKMSGVSLTQRLGSSSAQRPVLKCDVLGEVTNWGAQRGQGAAYQVWLRTNGRLAPLPDSHKPNFFGPRSRQS